MIDDSVKKLAQEANFAAFTTLMASGQPQTNIMWVDCDDENILINTETGRQKFKNVQRQPQVTVVIVDHANPYHYAEVRGRVVDTVRGDEARVHIDHLSQKYHGRPYDASMIQTERVILRIAPDRQRTQG